MHALMETEKKLHRDPKIVYVARDGDFAGVEKLYVDENISLDSTIGVSFFLVKY